MSSDALSPYDPTYVPKKMLLDWPPFGPNESGNRFFTLGNLERLAQIGIIVMGALALSGTLSLHAASISTCALAGLGFGLELAKGTVGVRKLAIFLNLAAAVGCVVLAQLAFKGMISPTLFGYGVIGTTLVAGALIFLRKAQVAREIDEDIAAAVREPYVPSYGVPVGTGSMPEASAPPQDL